MKTRRTPIKSTDSKITINKDGRRIVPDEMRVTPTGLVAGSHVNFAVEQPMMDAHYPDFQLGVTYKVRRVLLAFESHTSAVEVSLENLDGEPLGFVNPLHLCKCESHLQ